MCFAYGIASFGKTACRKLHLQAKVLLQVNKNSLCLGNLREWCAPREVCIAYAHPVFSWLIRGQSTSKVLILEATMMPLQPCLECLEWHGNTNDAPACAKRPWQISKKYVVP